MTNQIEIHIHKTYRTEGAYAGHWFREVSWRDECGEWHIHALRERKKRLVSLEESATSSPSAVAR